MSQSQIKNNRKKQRVESNEGTSNNFVTGVSSPLRTMASQPSTLEKAGSIPKLVKRPIPSKDNYFMSLAKLASTRSRDPSMQVGACLVDSTKRRVLGIGYNGAPNGIDDDLDFPWRLVEAADKNKCKNDFVIHAEANALALSDSALHVGSIMYCTHFPCKNCAKTMIHAGVKKIIYYDDSRRDEDAYQPSTRLLCFALEKGIASNEKYDISKHKKLMVKSEVEIRQDSCQNNSDDEPTDIEDNEGNSITITSTIMDEKDQVLKNNSKSQHTLAEDLENAEM